MKKENQKLPHFLKFLLHVYPQRTLPNRKQTGAALASVLMVVALGAVLAFTLAGTGMFHLNVSARTDNALQARNNAESAISRGIERVIDKITYGTARDVTETIEIKGDGGGTGYLTFSKDEATRLGIPWSTNNITNPAAVEGSMIEGDGRLVPQNSIHLVGKGTSGGVTKRIEAILHVPPFPFCIASSGKFSSSGKLLVGSVGSMAEIQGTIDPTKLKPGHVLSNSTAIDSLALAGEGKITGDLKTAGDVKIDPACTVEVLGEIKRHAEPVTLNPVDIASYDPASKPGVQSLTGFLENPKLEGYCRVTGDLNVAGNLELNGALLYVEGNLTVTDGVKGQGAIVVTGSTTIQKGAEISSDNLVAMLSGGDVKLSGSSTAASSFQGVVYTGGNFTADNISIMGAFVSNGQTAEVGNFSMSNVTAINNQGLKSVSVAIKTPAPPPAATPVPTPAPTAEPKYVGRVEVPFSTDPKYPIFTIKSNRDGTYSLRYTPNSPTAAGDTSDGNLGNYNTLDAVATAIVQWFDNMEGLGLYQYDACPYWDSCPGDGQSFDTAKSRAYSYLTSHMDVRGHGEPTPTPTSTAGAGGGSITPTESGAAGGEMFNFDLSQFLNIEDRIRIILWREI